MNIFLKYYDFPLSPCLEIISNSEDFVSARLNDSNGARTPATSRDVEVVGVEPDEVVVVVVDLEIKLINKFHKDYKFFFFYVLY